MDSAISQEAPKLQGNNNIEARDEKEVVTLPNSSIYIKERLFAISPAVIIGVLLGGWNAVIAFLLTGLTSKVSYLIYRKVTKVQDPWPLEYRYYLILLIALLPGTIPWWQCIIAGLGLTWSWIVYKEKAPFNIALALWLVIAFQSGANMTFGSSVNPEEMPYFNLYIANTLGGIGEYFLPALIAGGAYLHYKGSISLTLPLSFIGTVVGLSYLVGDNPLIHLLTGGLLIGALFLAPEMKNVSIKYKILYGLCSGILVILLRLFGYFLTAVPLVIFIMNWFQIFVGLPEEDKIPGWPLFTLVSMGLILAVFISDTSLLNEFFKTMNHLGRFGLIILAYLTLHKLTNSKYLNFNFPQWFFVTILILGLIK